MRGSTIQKIFVELARSLSVTGHVVKPPSLFIDDGLKASNRNLIGIGKPFTFLIIVTVTIHFRWINNSLWEWTSRPKYIDF